MVIKAWSWLAVQVKSFFVLDKVQRNVSNDATSLQLDES